MMIGSRIKVSAFKVRDMFGRMHTNEDAGRIGTVLQIGDVEKGSLAVKVELDGDTDFYYWFPTCFLAEATSRRK